MGRPVGLERRQEIALAAFEAIRVRGVYGVTMSELAALLGMKRPTLYFYFRDVGHVFETVLVHMLERQRAYLIERLIGVKHPIDLIQGYANAIWDFVDHEGPPLLALVTFWTHTERGEPKRVLEVINQHFLPLLALARQQLQAGIVKGQVAPCDPDALIDLVACIIDGSLVHRITRGIEFAGVKDLLARTVLGPLKLNPELAP